MPRNIIRQVSLITLCAMLCTACAPVYRTKYQYSPPRSEQAHECVQRCESLRLECESNLQHDYHMCERRKQDAYDNCVASQHYQKNEKTGAMECVGNCSCIRYGCGSPNLESCTERFNGCYSMCGGQVSNTTECVAHCD